MKRQLILLLVIFLGKCCLAQSVKDSLYVFVGEKISVVDSALKDKVDSTTDPGIVHVTTYMDGAFKCKYKVLKNVYNHLKNDTIEFVAFDHYGRPFFSNFQYVLLFVSQKKKVFYHQKYQFFDVYLTADNKWASPGDPYKNAEPSERTVSAIPIKFKKPVTFDIDNVSKENIAAWYPKPYFKIEGKKAIALMGTYVEDLFTVEKEGVLKARGIF